MFKFLSLLFIGLSMISFGEEIKIGVIYPKSGEYYYYGKTFFNFFSDYIESLNENGGVNGKSITLLEKDSEGDLIKTIESFDELEKEGALAVVGPFFNDSCLVLSEKSYEKELAILSPFASSEELLEKNDYFFMISNSSKDEGEIVSKLVVRDLKSKKAVIIFQEENKRSRELIDSFKEKSGEEIEVLGEIEAFNLKRGFFSRLEEFKESGLDLVYVAGEIVLDDINDLLMCDYKGSIIFSSDIVGNEIVESLDKSVYALKEHSAFSKYLLGEEVLKEKREKFGENISEASCIGYDAAKVLEEAIKQMNEVSREEFIMAMFKVRDLEGISEVLEMKSNRKLSKSMEVLIYNVDKWKFYKKIKKN